MTPTERLAQELRKIYADNGLTHIAFEEMAKHVQRMILDARIETTEKWQAKVPVEGQDEYLEELRSERNQIE